MKISFTKYPADIILCMICSLALLPIVIFDIQDAIRIIIGLPFILFIPGYIFIFTLFPAKKTIDIFERIALSFGLSIAIVPMIGLGLNYTPYGITLESVYLSLLLFNLSFSIIAIYRWYKTIAAERFTISFHYSFSTSEKKLDKALTIILLIVIVITIISLIYVITTPKVGERFTEFYILGPEGVASNYPRNLTFGQPNNNITLGVVNHEYKAINYTIEVWLINQTTILNEIINETSTTIHNMWFLEKITTTLNHTDVHIEQPWMSQWEQNYTFTPFINGSFKLTFLLFTTPTEDYVKYNDYQETAEEIINTAYSELHLFLNVK